MQAKSNTSSQNVCNGSLKSAINSGRIWFTAFLCVKRHWETIRRGDYGRFL